MYHDQLITIGEAVKLLPKLRGNWRRHQTVAAWCERAKIVEVEGPKMVYKGQFLALMRQMGKLPAEPIRLTA